MTSFWPKLFLESSRQIFQAVAWKSVLYSEAATCGLTEPFPARHSAAAAKSLQSCPTLCDPIEGSPPGSPVPGILQARVLEWVAIAFSARHSAAAAAAKSLRSCPTLCDPRDGSPPGSPVPGTPQARTLEWVAISFSNAWKWKVKLKLLSHDRLIVTPWTAAHQAPPSMGFSRQEYWSGVPLSSPQDTLVIRKPYRWGVHSGKAGWGKCHCWWEKGETNRSGKTPLLKQESRRTRQGLTVGAWKVQVYVLFKSFWWVNFYLN